MTDPKTFLILTAKKLEALSPKDRARYLEKLAARTLRESMERLAAEDAAQGARSKTKKRG